VAEGRARVRERIAAACARAGRDPAGVELVAVSKLQPLPLLVQAYEAGHRAFGENYAQELRDKSQALASRPGIRWHFIGPLQTNKARYVARSAHVFHALDRLGIAEELSRRRQGAPLHVLLQVWSGEETKSGVSAEEAPALAEQVRALPGLQLVGLMAMPPLQDDPERARPHFRAVRALAERLGLPQLSMGTTSDFEVAIEEGATMVRVGTAIFGARAP